MTDPRDIVDIDGLRHSQDRSGVASSSAKPGSRKKFLSIWFRCCHVYGRMYRNAAQSAYEGRCPRCGCAVSALIGADGTNQRTFQAW